MSTGDWAIYNETQGKYVRAIGPYEAKGSSFTANPIGARRFPTREAAQADCCGDEHPVNLRERLGF